MRNASLRFPPAAHLNRIKTDGSGDSGNEGPGPIFDKVVQILCLPAKSRGAIRSTDDGETA